MATNETLITFLNKHAAPRGDRFTHTTFSKDNSQNLPGRIFVGEDELDLFYDLYIDWVDVYGKQICITEANTNNGLLRVDFDFLYEKTVRINQHTREQLIQFVKLYMAEASKYLTIEQPIEVYVSEKKKAVLKGDKVSAGVHIMVPDLITTKWIEMKIRDNLLDKLGEIFGALPLVEKDWNKVYDRGVAARSANWMMYHASKSDGLPYMIKYVMTFHPKSCDIEISTDVPEMNVDFMKRLSVRKDDEDATEMTDFAREEFGNTKKVEQNNEVITGGRSATPQRGRLISRGDKIPSRELSPEGGTRQRPLTEEEKTYYYKHAMNLDCQRYDNYEEWLAVGICLWNIHPIDLHDVWHEFSSQSQRYKFKDADQKWMSFSYRIDGAKLSKKSLLFWSRTDSIDGYVEIEKTNVDSLIQQSVSSATEYDVAQVVHAKFHDSYACGHFSRDSWFKFNGQVWTETDKGVDLRFKLSDDVWKMYNRKRAECALALSDLPNCESKNKDECGCSTCKMKATEKSYEHMCKQLKKTAFKSCVMSEASLLFYDREFIQRLNEKHHLIAFNNCIFDADAMEFRNGKQEDYIQFSTKIDIDADKHYTAYPAWSEVERFLVQILPEDDVREYVMKYLASCISGSTDSQKFHIWTGTGANGKSMLMNLMEEALGDYSTKANIAMFTQGRAKTGSASPEQVRMRGKRFVTMSEPDEAYAPLNTGLIKEYTSGERISARDLFAKSSEMIEFVLRCKFNLGCNDLPKINSTDNGTWRRIIQLRFSSEFRPNPKNGQYKLDESIQHKVRSKPWAQAFMAYLIHIFIASDGCKSLNAPERIVASTNEYKQESDAIARFMNECLRAIPEDSTEIVVPVRKETLQETFRSWRVQNEQLRVNMEEMSKRIQTLYGKYPKGCKSIQGGWKNFQIVEQD